MSLKTLDSALNLLSYFDATNPQWGVRELAKVSGLNSSVVQRMLATYADHGFLVQKQPSRKYALGMAFIEYAQRLRQNLHLSDLVRPLMQSIANNASESVFLTIKNGTHALYMEIVETNASIKFSVNIGTQVALHVGANAKVILAYMPEAEQAEIFKSPLERYTDKTVTDVEILKIQLAKIKQDGWSYTRAEYADDAYGIAVPLLNSEQQILGSLGISGPISRLDESRVESLVGCLKAQQASIAHLLTLYG